MQRIDELGFVRRGERAHAGNHAAICDVEDAVVGGPVLAHDPRAIDGEHHVAARKRIVDDHLVERALQERRVYCDDRLEFPEGQPSRHPDGVFLRDAHVDEPIRELVGEFDEAGARAHGRRDGDDVLVDARLAYESMPEHVGIGRRSAALLRAKPGLGIVGADAMEPHRVVFGRLVSRALLGYDVHEHRAVGVERRAQYVAHRPDVVPVDGRRAQDAKLFEHHGLGHEEVLHRILHAAPEIDERLADRAALLERFLRAVTRLTIARRRPNGPQVTHERPDVAGNGHLVVVEHDDDGQLQLSDGVERFEGHAARKRRVADQRHDLLVRTAQVARLRQTERHRKRVGRMAGRMHVVRTLARPRKPGNAPACAQRAERLPTPGDYLMRIRLMADVENELVFGRVDKRMNGQDYLDCAERRRDVAARLRRDVDYLLANLPRKDF